MKKTSGRTDLSALRRFGFLSAALALRGESGEIRAVRGRRENRGRVWGRQFDVVRLLRKIEFRLFNLLESSQQHHAVPTGYGETVPGLTPLTIEAVESLARVVRAGGGNSVLMVVPSRAASWDPQGHREVPEFSHQWKTWASRQGIPFVELARPFHRVNRPDFPLFLERNIHFSALGHAVVAQEIRRAWPSLFVSESGHVP